ncbi:DFP2-like protein, partial [Euroglyphus maynei]
GGGGPQVIKGAIQSRQTFEVRPVPIQVSQGTPRIVEFDGGSAPLKLHFKSSGGRIQIMQTNGNGYGSEPEYTQSEEEPQRLIHEVKKPIIQEVREIIIPYRKVVQEVRPAKEEVKTIVSQGQGGGGGYGGSSGG